ncbi:MAG: flagellar M-ring protein FliF [Nocardioidaceae bacterium]|nr:flagellar M-ring protein FliF [Nocardioidaceae bacterium]
MKQTVTRYLARYQRTFSSLNTGQKVAAALGTGALLLAGFLVFRWASTPSYAPLFSDLSSSDASAVIDKLDASGTPYKITNGGSTVMVPKDKVYSSRIALSGDGLPSSSGSGSGYDIMKEGGLSASNMQEQVNFKRAMETELSHTIEAINGVSTAVVHLALPEKQVFADKQDPATASVLVATKPGSTLDPEQVQAIVHLVASSIDGLDPDKVTVADASGKVLSVQDDGSGTAAASTRAQQVSDYQDQVTSRIQAMLDRIVGTGNSTVTVTANLDFDKTTTEKKSYTYNKQNVPLSSTKASEKYSGVNPNGQTGVVGPDGQMDSTGTAGTNGSYEKTSETSDNAVDTTVEHRETAPGSVRNLHVGVVLDAATARTIDPNVIQSQVASAVGIDTARGDTAVVSVLPFDRSAEKAAAKELAEAKKADASAQQWGLIRNSGLVVLIVLILLLAWLKGRRRAKARAEATSYLVEQLRQEGLDRAAAQAELETSPAVLALEQAEKTEEDELREELAALVERQPEDVASLLRGWLVERP